MSANTGKTALVTGASGGIGYELTRLFARDGYNLVLVARSADKLNEMKQQYEARAGISVHVIVKDLAQPSAPQEIFDELQRGGIAVDVLVNNAGFTVFGRFLETDLEKELQLMQVNIVALTHLTKLFVPGMVERGWGKVLNLASVAAFFPGPLMSVYYASKAYVLSFSEALAVELEGTGVTVTALCPGLTETGFQERGNMEESRLLAGGGMMDARTVARIGYRGMVKGRMLVITGLRNRVLVHVARFIPGRLLGRGVLQAQDRV
ncbi:MAG: SDR family oxidoreductase [Chloroflexota bacterium]|nr:SDR family oxidoreductase [Chloroflexota bacterium]MDQ5865067.1 SDR family oxidoreductase [Chloroflexota bacterium]